MPFRFFVRHSPSAYLARSHGFKAPCWSLWSPHAGVDAHLYVCNVPSEDPTYSCPECRKLSHCQTTNPPLSIAVSSTNASDFAKTDNCVGSAPAGASCSLSMTLALAAAGSRMGTLMVANNLCVSPLPVPLARTGVTPIRVVRVSAGTLILMNQIVGPTSAARGITLAVLAYTLTADRSRRFPRQDSTVQLWAVNEI